MTEPDPQDLDRVATAALSRVQDGMLLGLGTGRAAEAFIRKLGERVRAGLRVKGVPTSNRSEKLARESGIELVGLDSIQALDIAFDGADEVASNLDLTKGLGGALLREKVVANEARSFVVLVTPEKLVEKLGSRTPIPIEVVPFAEPTVTRHLGELGGRAVVRTTAERATYLTDNHNLVLDTDFGQISDPGELEVKVRSIPGVVETGFFLSMAKVVLVGAKDGVITLTQQ